MAGLSCPTFERRAHLGNGSVDGSHKSKDRKDHFEEKHHVEIKFLEIEVVLIFFESSTMKSRLYRNCEPAAMLV